jgi:hypothetical protein
MWDPKHKVDIGAEVEAFLREEAAAGRRYRSVFRDEDRPSLVIDLLDPLDA